MLRVLQAAARSPQCWWQRDDVHDLKSWRLGEMQMCGWPLLGLCLNVYFELSSPVQTKEDWIHVISLVLGTFLSLENG